MMVFKVFRAVLLQVVNIPSFIEKTTPLKYVGLGWEKPPKMAPKNIKKSGFDFMIN